MSFSPIAECGRRLEIANVSLSLVLGNPGEQLATLAGFGAQFLAALEGLDVVVDAQGVTAEGVTWG